MGTADCGTVVYKWGGFELIPILRSRALLERLGRRVRCWENDGGLWPASYSQMGDIGLRKTLAKHGGRRRGWRGGDPPGAATNAMRALVEKFQFKIKHIPKKYYSIHQWYLSTSVTCSDTTITVVKFREWLSAQLPSYLQILLNLMHSLFLTAYEKNHWVGKSLQKLLCVPSNSHELSSINGEGGLWT